MRDDSRANVAWDIETTGFGEDDVITTSGFLYPDNHATIILNTDGVDVEGDTLARRLSEKSGVDVSVQSVPNERDLLDQMGKHVFSTFDRDYNRLIAYNAESWKGGFDLPFIRRRCLHHDQTWMFKNVRFTDLWDIADKRVNTTRVDNSGEVSDVNDLVGTHKILCNPAEDIDPFDDSERAVECFKRHEFEPLVTHNLSDIVKTWELGESLREVVSPRDWSEKPL